jgi:hypothetical protein
MKNRAQVNIALVPHLCQPLNVAYILLISNIKTTKMKTTLIILGVIIVILVGFRIYLPVLVKDQINKNINEAEGISGKVDNVSLSLLRGNIHLSDIDIYNEEYPDPSTPIVRLAQSNISVSWTSLFNRRIVAEIHLDSLLVNYVILEEPVEEEEVDIVQELRELMSFEIDIIITNSTINFADITADPNIEFSLTDVTLEARYLTNDEIKEDSLPSRIVLSATATNSGSIESDIKINYMKDIPDFDIEMEIENVDMTEFNELTLAYGGFEVAEGFLNVYIEAAANDGLLVGYIKPVVEDIEITPSEDDAGLFQRMYEAVLDFAASILESPDEEHVATIVEFEGRIDDPEVGVWPAFWNLLRNGFVEGFSKGLEQAIDFEDLTDQ